MGPRRAGPALYEAIGTATACLRAIAAQHAQAGESARQEAIAQAASGLKMREIGPALLLCMLTSSIAFLSFLPTDYLGLGELGIISAGGMAVALLLTFTWIPVFFTLSSR